MEREGLVWKLNGSEPDGRETYGTEAKVKHVRAKSGVAGRAVSLAVGCADAALQSVTGAAQAQDGHFPPCSEPIESQELKKIPAPHGSPPQSLAGNAGTLVFTPGGHQPYRRTAPAIVRQARRPRCWPVVVAGQPIPGCGGPAPSASAAACPFAIRGGRPACRLTAAACAAARKKAWNC